jgi:hypothetical protein
VTISTGDPAILRAVASLASFITEVIPLTLRQSVLNSQFENSVPAFPALVDPAVGFAVAPEYLCADQSLVHAPQN